MGSYHVILSSSAERELLSLPAAVQKRIEPAIDKLADLPRPPGVTKLKGTSGLWRIRVGDYRVIYGVDDKQKTVDISHIRHRKDAYR